MTSLSTARPVCSAPWGRGPELPFASQLLVSIIIVEREGGGGGGGGRDTERKGERGLEKGEDVSIRSILFVQLPFCFLCLTTGV